MSRQRSQGPHEIDWKQRRRDWLTAIERLYRQVTGELLADAIAQKLVSESRKKKKITEEYLGTYSVDELILDIGGEIVTFSPKGRNIIGAKGRVDLIGQLGTTTLVLDPEGQWNVVASRAPRQHAVLNRSTLADALQRLMR